MPAISEPCNAFSNLIREDQGLQVCPAHLTAVKMKCHIFTITLELSLSDPCRFDTTSSRDYDTSNL